MVIITVVVSSYVRSLLQLVFAQRDRQQPSIVTGIANPHRLHGAPPMRVSRPEPTVQFRDADIDDQDDRENKDESNNGTSPKKEASDGECGRGLRDQDALFSVEKYMSASIRMLLQNKATEEAVQARELALNMAAAEEAAANEQEVAGADDEDENLEVGMQTQKPPRREMSEKSNDSDEPRPKHPRMDVKAEHKREFWGCNLRYASELESLA